MSIWKDIETAPKDRRIIIATDTDMFVANWVQNPFTGNEAWRIAVFEADAESSNQVLIKHGLAKSWAEAPEHPFNQSIIDEDKK
jgi:hypothetical protein